MINELYQDRKAVIAWLKDAPPSYKRWLESVQRTCLKELRNYEDAVKVYRTQGQLMVVDRLIGLEEELIREPK